MKTLFTIDLPLSTPRRAELIIVAAPQRQALDYDAASLITVSLGPQTSLSKPLKITRLVFTLVTTRESVGKVLV